jgi:hypothetical protein
MNRRVLCDVRDAFRKHLTSLKLFSRASHGIYVSRFHVSRDTQPAQPVHSESCGVRMPAPLGVTVGWRALFTRTLKETVSDNCFGLSAQLA